MVPFLTFCAELALAGYLLVFAIRQWETITEWTFGWILRGIEKAFPRFNARQVGRAILDDAKGKAAFAIHTVAEPFVEIARSFLPRFEIAREGAAPSPVIEVPPPVTEKPVVPSDEEYKLAVNKLGAPPACTKKAARDGWFKLQKTDPAAANEAWAIICAYRNWSEK